MTCWCNSRRIRLSASPGAGESGLLVFTVRLLDSETLLIQFTIGKGDCLVVPLPVDGSQPLVETRDSRLIQWKLARYGMAVTGVAVVELGNIIRELHDVP